jgi:nicotinamidase-related amidase
MDLGHLEDLVSHHRAALVIIDVLNSFLSGKVDGYRDQDVRGALHPISKLAERTGATVVCLRHLSKTGGPTPSTGAVAASASSGAHGPAYWSPPIPTTTPAGCWP